MGLLDDAIREHMELKRLHGVDPGVLAREEQDVLGPVRREDDAASPTTGDGVAGSAEIAPENSLFGEGDSSRGPQPQPVSGPDFANVGQETAELDMRTVLGGEHESTEAPVEDALEETPGSPRDTPEQDRLWLEQQPPQDFDFDK